MKRIRIYRNPECAKCGRIGRVHQFFDWANRLEISTATPPTGPLRQGEIVVEDFATGRILRGAEALDAICKNIPAYFPVRLLLKLRSFRRKVDVDLSGCRDGSCDVAGKV